MQKAIEPVQIFMTRKWRIAGAFFCVLMVLPFLLAIDSGLEDVTMTTEEFLPTGLGRFLFNLVTSIVCLMNAARLAPVILMRRPLHNFDETGYHRPFFPKGHIKWSDVTKITLGRHTHVDKPAVILHLDKSLKSLTGHEAAVPFTPEDPANADILKRVTALWKQSFSPEKPATP